MSRAWQRRSLATPLMMLMMRLFCKHHATVLLHIRYAWWEAALMFCASWLHGAQSRLLRLGWHGDTPLKEEDRSNGRHGARQTRQAARRRCAFKSQQTCDERGQDGGGELAAVIQVAGQHGHQGIAVVHHIIEDGVWRVLVHCHQITHISCGQSVSGTKHNTPVCARELKIEALLLLAWACQVAGGGDWRSTAAPLFGLLLLLLATYE